MRRWLTIYFTLLIIPAVYAQQPELVLPVGHTKIVRTAMFSPDNKFVITGGADNIINIWETFSGKKVRSLIDLNAEVRYAFFSNDSKYLVAGSDSTMIIWSVPSYAILGKYNFVRTSLFSPDSKKLFLLSWDGTAKQFNLPSMVKEQEYPDRVFYMYYWNRVTTAVSPDSRLLCIGSDTLVTIRDITSGKIVSETRLKGNPLNCFFTNDGKYLIAVSTEGIQQIDMNAGFAITDLSNEKIELTRLSSNNRFLLTVSGDLFDVRSVFWDLEKYKPLFTSDTIRSVSDTFFVYEDKEKTIGKVTTGTAAFSFPGNILPRTPGTNTEISGNGNYISLMNYVWNTRDNTRSYRIEENSIRNSDISKDNKYLLIQQKEGTVELWDIALQKTIQSYETRSEKINIAALSPDGTKFLFSANSNTLGMVDISTGRVMYNLKHRDEIAFAEFSMDGKKVLTNSFDSTAKLWDAGTGELLQNFPKHYAENNPAYYTKGGTLAFIPLNYDTIPVYDINDVEKIVRYEVMPSGHYTAEDLDYFRDRKSYTGRYFFELHYYTWRLVDSLEKKVTLFDQTTYVYKHAFSRDDKWLAIVTGETYPDTIRVWDLQAGKWLFSTGLDITAKNMSDYRGVNQLFFTDDKKYILVNDDNDVIHVLATASDREEFSFRGQRSTISNNGKYLLTINQGKCDLYDFEKRRLLYSYILLDSVNYLVTDEQKRFDGTETARKLLYLSCGMEIIELDQAKDQLWVPDLAERLMKGDPINNKTLEEINICGLTPEVEDKRNAGADYFFLISPRRGGLGETVVYVNGIEARRYRPAELRKNGDVYELLIKKEELESFFIAGKENPVTVKAFTADNTISSRGVIIIESSERSNIITPNLYAVMVGISDYKGDELDLKFAAKDAIDLSGAVSNAARKLLNTDGKEHVFMYNLTTAAGRSLLPEKNSIRKTFEEIGKKATANDILLVFFAGHGVMEGDKKQFYFLTADASKASAASAIAEVGISTAELTEWMKPQQIKAQKRILIFDACNSGQAIKDFVKIGKDDQGYIAARNDEKGQQVKAIEKLNEQSGLFILSASASNQNAYEMGRYSQGLLTYSLLKAIKEQPDILQDGKYLDVSRWFNAAEKTVSEMTRDNGARQQPQIVSNTNFNIGLVDEDVIAKIVLPTEKPLFTASIFQNNDEAIGDDDLELSKLTNRELAGISARGDNSKILYMTATNSPDVYTLTGRYEVKGNNITVKVNLKQNREIKNRFEISGTKDKLDELAAAIAAKASGLVK